MYIYLYVYVKLLFSIHTKIAANDNSSSSSEAKLPPPTHTPQGGTTPLIKFVKHEALSIFVPLRQIQHDFLYIEFPYFLLMHCQGYNKKKKKTIIMELNVCQHACYKVDQKYN